MRDLYIESICGKEKDWIFWSNNLTWTTNYPQLSLCFQSTVLSWIPAAIILLILPCHFYAMLKRPSASRSIFIGWMSVLKIILCLVIAGASIASLVLSIKGHSHHPNSPAILFIQPSIDIFLMFVMIITIVLERRKGVYSSALVYAFWTLFTLCQGLVVVSKAMFHIDPKLQHFHLLEASIKFGASFLTWLLHCFSDYGSGYDISERNITVDEGTPLLQNRVSTAAETKKQCPEVTASALSRFSFSWITRLVFLGYRRPLTENDLWDLQYSFTSGGIVPPVEKDWRRAEEKACERDGYIGDCSNNRYSNIPDVSIVQPKKKVKVSLLGVLFRNFSSYGLAGVYKFCSDMLSFAQPQLLSVMIAFVKTGNTFIWHGYLLAVALFLVAMSRTYIFQQYFHGCYTTGMRLRTAIIGLVYRKALRLSSTARKEKTVGEIVNLMAVDAQRLQDAPNFLHNIWTAPIQIVIAIVFLWGQLGPSVLAGVGILVLLIPLNALLSFKIRDLQIIQMKLKDERIKVMNEVLNGVKVLKLYAWELSFSEKISEIREREVRILRKAAYISCVSAVSWFCAPFLVSLSTFAVYVLSSSDHVLTAQKAFVSLSLFNILQFPMAMFPGTINMGIQTMVSVRRINTFLESDELDPDAVEHQPAGGYGSNSQPALKIANGSFTWDDGSNPTLSDINIEIPTGKLIAVVGEVGSGKTSLMSALIGEMHKLSGLVQVKGRVAYVPQQAWCQNASLKDNILFGESMNRSKYESVLEACALKPDLEVLPAGDQTEIGEKGINLSGGQKQRVSLARAAYSDADVYLFDDPLSAVDAHVGRHIFDQVFAHHTGMLRHKTRILVTHALSFLPQCDAVIVMRDGRIDVTGSYNELLAEDGAFAEFLRDYLQQQTNEDADEDAEETEDSELAFKRTLLRRISSMNEEKDDGKPRRRQRQTSQGVTSICSDGEKEEKEEKKKERHRLIESETSEVGSVKFGVVLIYLSAISWAVIIALLIAYMGYIGFEVGSNIWLSKWSTANTTLPNGQQDTQQRDLYLGIYGLLGFLQTLGVAGQNLCMAIGSYNASRGLHLAILKNVLRAPMSFFDTTPMGRILNRFSKDIDTVDMNIPMTIRAWLTTVSGVATTLVIVTYASPVFLIALIPLGVCYYFIQRFYVKSSRQLKRIDSVRRSPIYSHFQESIVGASSIRSYNKLKSFINKSDLLVDENQRVWFPNIVSFRWLGIYLETLGNCIILLAAIFAVIYRESMGPGVAGLSISYALQITSSLSFSVRMTTDLETYIVAIERIKEYSEIANEAPLETDIKPSLLWPEEGVVSFKNYSVRYRPDLDLVLRDIDVNVKAGERVGIVGRTGAGKSSLTLALFRILEPSAGTIEIDGVDITKIGLHDLRSKITIIPQDPVLFSGTLRMNLDPSQLAPDASLWKALEQAGLNRFVSSQADGLDFQCSEGGENLSVGQRQLVCLARALLRRTRVLVLDEATAAVDMATDEFIQSTIRSEFEDCTVITIAHRLNTIMDYDKIMVLDKGAVKEMDTPKNLLADINSVFYSMAREANLV